MERNQILPVPKGRNASDVVIHTPRNTWNTAKAKKATCRGCGMVGHYQKCCKKTGKFPGKSSKKAHILEATSTSTQYFNKRGEDLTFANVNMLSSKVNPSKALIIEFGCEISHDSHRQETSTEA